MQQLSPVFIGLVSIAALFLLGLFLMDRRRARNTNHVGSLMKAFVLKHAMRPISVVIAIENWDERIWGTLRHLESLEYEQLRVLAIAGPEIDLPLVRKLRQFQRSKRKSLIMTVAQRRMNTTERSVILRYAKGDAILWLSAGETVSENCFRRISVELLNESAGSFSIRELPQVDDSLRSATRALDAIANRLLFKGRGTVRVVRADVFRNNSTEHPTAIEDASIITPHHAQSATSGLAAVLLILATIIAGVAATMSLPSGAQLLVGTFYGVFLFLIALSTLSSSYRTPIHGSLILLLPLWPILSFLYMVIDVALSLIRRYIPIKKLRPSTNRNA